jgi:hypothetical protein
MTAAQRAQTLALDPEISSSVTKAEPKDHERNRNKNKKLLRQCDEEPDSRRIDP